MLQIFPLWGEPNPVGLGEPQSGKRWCAGLLPREIKEENDYKSMVELSFRYRYSRGVTGEIDEKTVGLAPYYLYSSCGRVALYWIAPIENDGVVPDGVLSKIL